MSSIIAIGGGEIRSGKTLPIDHEIINTASSAHPQVLFIPTASDDSVDYWNAFKELYSDTLHCASDVLFLSKEKNRNEIEKKINTADIIYVGGGNTLKMMRRWRFLKVDILLQNAYKKGQVLCGLSAGALCWFQKGYSDSLHFYNDTKPYIQVTGLGFVSGIICPEYDDIKRKKAFIEHISKHGGQGIGIESYAALKIQDDHISVLSALANTKAYRIYRKANKVIEEIIT